MGIERTFQKMRQAQIVMLLIDANRPVDMLNESIAKVNDTIDRDQQKLIVCLNKIDLCKDTAALAKQLVGLNEEDKLMFISAKEQENTDEFATELLKVVNMDTLNEQDVIVTNARHFEALNSALVSIQRVNDGLANLIPTDFLAQDIRECLHFLGEIIGDVSTDEVFGNIFKNFCIGK